MGWPQKQPVVIDDALGRFLATGFKAQRYQRLMPEDGMGPVGIIMGLEVSRLALNYWNVNPGWRHGLLIQHISKTGCCLVLERQHAGSRATCH